MAIGSLKWEVLLLGIWRKSSARKRDKSGLNLRESPTLKTFVPLSFFGARGPYFWPNFCSSGFWVLWQSQADMWQHLQNKGIHCSAWAQVHPHKVQHRSLRDRMCSKVLEAVHRIQGNDEAQARPTTEIVQRAALPHFDHNPLRKKETPRKTSKSWSISKTRFRAGMFRVGLCRNRWLQAEHVLATFQTVDAWCDIGRALS